MSFCRKAAALCALLGCCVFLAGSGKSGADDKAYVLRLWNDTAACYNALAEDANQTGRSADAALAASFSTAAEALERCRSELERTSGDAVPEHIAAELSEAASLLAECREAMLLPYDTTEQQLYRSASAAAALYRELCALIRQNGWDYDKSTLAMMDSAADTIAAAAAALSGESAPCEEDVLMLIAALDDFSAQGATYRSAFSPPWRPAEDDTVLH